MWQPYIDVIKARAPQAVLVFDKFHIVRHLMAAVDQPPVTSGIESFAPVRRVGSRLT